MKELRNRTNVLSARYHGLLPYEHFDLSKMKSLAFPALIHNPMCSHNLLENSWSLQANC